MQVYSLVSSAKCHSPRLHTIPSGYRACSFINHLNSLGSIQPGCRFRGTRLFNTQSLHCLTRYSLPPGSRECTREQSALPRSTRSEHIHRSRGSNPQSLVCTSRTLPLSHDAPHDKCRKQNRKLKMINNRRRSKDFVAPIPPQGPHSRYEGHFILFSPVRYGTIRHKVL